MSEKHRQKAVCSTIACFGPVCSLKWWGRDVLVFFWFSFVFVFFFIVLHICSEALGGFIAL